MNTYNVNFTDKSIKPVSISEADTLEIGGINLFGRIKEEYGELLDIDFLNLLENFSCPETSNSSYKNAYPDLTKTSAEQLKFPIVGQIWYNSTRENVYYWDSVKWNVIGVREDLAANWGQIMDGGQIPKPVSAITGKTFEYGECIWTVSPAALTGQVGYVSCAADDNAVVEMKYRLVGTSYTISGLANYLIIGIRGNNNFGEIIPPIELTPTPTPSSTPQSTPASTPPNTPPVTPSKTPQATPNSTPNPTPPPSPSKTPQATPAGTPAPTPTATPQIPLSSLVFGGTYSADSRVVSGACSGAGIGFSSNGTVGKSGLNTNGPSRWLAVGQNASLYEISFSGDWLDDGPSAGFYQTPAGNNTMGSPSVWYNLGGGLAFSAGVCGNGLVTLSIGYAIRRVGDTSGEVVTGSITCSGTAGTPL